MPISLPSNSTLAVTFGFLLDVIIVVANREIVPGRLHVKHRDQQHETETNPRCDPRPIHRRRGGVVDTVASRHNAARRTGCRIGLVLLVSARRRNWYLFAIVLFWFSDGKGASSHS